MITSLPTPNLAKTARRIIRSQILPGTGRGTASWRWRGRVRLGAYFDFGVLASTGPSVASRHLPVPGRIF
jgi:hypothetical protein